MPGFLTYFTIFLISSVTVALTLGNAIFLGKLNKEIIDNPNCNVNIDQKAIKWYLALNSVISGICLAIILGLIIYLIYTMTKKESKTNDVELVPVSDKTQSASQSQPGQLSKSSSQSSLITNVPQSGLTVTKTS